MDMPDPPPRRSSEERDSQQSGAASTNSLCRIKKARMTKKWIAITLLLFVATGLLGWQLYVSVLRFNAENDLSKIQPVRDIKQKIVQDKSQPRLAPPVSHTPTEFAVIPENNVFSESRTREEKTDGAASMETPPLTQKPILVGVSIEDNQRRASIIDPASPSPGTEPAVADQADRGCLPGVHHHGHLGHAHCSRERHAKRNHTVA